MAMQTALRCNSSIPIPLVIQPVAMRHYAGGRSDPSYPRTTASTALVDAILDPSSDPSRIGGLFKQALTSHKTLIKAAKAGAGVGWHLQVMNEVAQNAEFEVAVLIRAWGRFSGMGGPLVYVTGFDHSPGILHSMSNLYANNLLASWYNITSGVEVSGCNCSVEVSDASVLLQEVEVSLNLAGTGVFQKDVLDHITDVLSATFDKLIHIAQIEGTC